MAPEGRQSRNGSMSLAQAGLDPEHEAVAGAQSGLALEAALRQWAISVGFQSKGEDTLSNLFNWLRANGHISDDDRAQLDYATRIRNKWYASAERRLAGGMMDRS